LFREADCDTDHCLVVAEVRERLAESKQTKHRIHMERFSLNKLKEVEGKEQYHVEISCRFAAFENLQTLRWILIELGKLLERISEFQPRRV
jgi:hypothetical protein